ncbi:MAG TPA: hypothetical protein VG166_13135, partial [Caulobacteraceae bacterium]|nr:hypothetical protein [Caulobacteraceae bacterium]
GLDVALELTPPRLGGAVGAAVHGEGRAPVGSGGAIAPVLLHFLSALVAPLWLVLGRGRRGPAKNAQGDQTSD